MSKAVFESEKDYELGKILKKSRPNPVGEDVFLRADGSLERDEDKIIAVQRIWKHEYYKPDGRGFLKAIESYNASQ